MIKMLMFFVAILVTVFGTRSAWLSLSEESRHSVFEWFGGHFSVVLATTLAIVLGIVFLF